MSAILESVDHQLDQEGPVAPDQCFASITLWQIDAFYLEVHHGQFDSMGDAEAFGAREDLGLTDILTALFLRTGEKTYWVPDAAFHIYRDGRSANIALEDFLGMVDIEAMRCIGMGHTLVERGKPLQILDTVVAVDAEPH